MRDLHLRSGFALRAGNASGQQQDAEEPSLAARLP